MNDKKLRGVIEHLFILLILPRVILLILSFVEVMVA
jgi:hypothetical protein